MNNKLVASIVGLAVCVILVGSVLAPVIDDVQTNAGDPITYTNTEKYPRGTLARPIEVGDELVCSSGEIKLNGEPVLRLDSGAPTYDGIALCDQFGVRTGGDLASVYFLTSGTSVVYGGTTVVTSPEPGIVNVTREGVTFYNGPYEFCYVACPNNEATTTMSIGAGLSPTSGVYVSNPKDVCMSGAYTSGENDTGYWYYDGVLHIGQDYSHSIDLNLELVEGTTDIYISYPVINIGNESFTPYYIIAPIEVTGHKDSGGTYALYGAIPVLVLAALVISAITIIKPRN